MLDKIRINCPDLFERSSFSRCFRGFPPPVLDHRPERGLSDDWRLLLTGRTTQDPEHFAGALRAGRDEQRVRRVYTGSCDRFSVRKALLAQPVAVIVCRRGSTYRMPPSC